MNEFLYMNGDAYMTLDAAVQLARNAMPSADDKAVATFVLGLLEDADDEAMVVDGNGVVSSQGEADVLISSAIARYRFFADEASSQIDHHVLH